MKQVGSSQFMAALEQLDDEQRKAVFAPPGTVRIIAGAGTGKTTALTHRIAYWHHEGSMPSSKVLAMTHSNKAAKELRKRLSKLGISDVTAKTFHALALQLLRDNWKHWQGNQDFPEIMKVTDQHFAIKAITEKLLQNKVSDARFIREYDAALSQDVRGELTLARSLMVKPENYLSNIDLFGPGNGLTRQDFFLIYNNYTKTKRSRNLIDFADLLEFAIDMLEGMEDIRKKVQNKYLYYFIDEYQDIDPVQDQLLSLIKGESQYLSVVGDPRQTIYSFKGSEPRFLIDFNQFHANALSVELVKNYRSTGRIVDQANTLMRNSTASGSAKLDLISIHEIGTFPRIEEYDAQNQELAAIVSRIRQLTDQEEIEPNEIAILVRINSNIPVIRAYLSKAGIETKSPGDNFWEDVMPLLNRFHSAFETSVETSGLKLLKEVATRLDWWREEPTNEKSTYRQDLTEALLTLVLQIDANDKLTPDELLKEFTRMKDSYIDDDDVNSVTVTSIHKAKGLEWDAVFLPMFIDGLYPISYARDIDEIDEEQRVLYVGITRPRKYLTLSWSNYSNISRRPQRISRFANKLKQESAIPENPHVVAERRREQSASLRGISKGDRVNHQKYGLGKVVGFSGDVLQIDFGKTYLMDIPVDAKDFEKL